MSDNLDFMAIFGGKGRLDLGNGGEDFDALFAEKETVSSQSPIRLLSFASSGLSVSSWLIFIFPRPSPLFFPFLGFPLCRK